VRDAAPAAALVEQHDPVDGGVEQPALQRGRAAAGTAVQEHHRLAGLVPADLPVDPVPVPDVEHAVRVRVDRRVEEAHAPSVADA
jgi:hypothetical protein